MKIVKRSKNKIKCIRDESTGHEITPEDLGMSNKLSPVNELILKQAMKAHNTDVKKVGLFDLLNDLNHGKSNLIEGNEKTYVPYIINSMLAQHEDSIFSANEMNMRHKIPNDIQFKYLSNSLRRRKRFGKKNKQVVNENILAVAKIENISIAKAKILLDTVLLEIDKLPKEYLERLDYL